METSLQISNRLFLRTTQGIKLGLDRMQAAAAKIGNPQNSYKSFHVAGTNGKGSVCAYLESCLRGMGFSTGLFTSPHIIDFEERFIIGGRPVLSGAWVDVYRDLETVIEEFELTFFEASTLICFELFKREKVEWAVFETGMGGRLDATNVLMPQVSVIAKIAMDHMSFLGNNLESIAREKLGIAKPQTPLIMIEPDEPAIRKLAFDWCLQNKIFCSFVSQVSAKRIELVQGRFRFEYRNQAFSLPLAGRHQVLNALAAISALAAAGLSTMDAIAAGIRSAVLPGRFQIVEIKGKTFVFDVGHNPDAAESFVKTLSATYPAMSVGIVAGIMKDKDIAGILKCYCSVASRLLLASPQVERSATTAELRVNVPHEFTGVVLETKSVAAAADAALASPEDVVCIVGSFYTVAEGMIALGQRPYAI
jgi:dihydrofolate synthase/folylpolyglutamate synthase